MQGPPLSMGLVQPMIGAFNKSDSKTKGMPLEIKRIHLEVNKMSFRSKGNPFRSK